MNIFDKISSTDKDMINYYIDRYSGGSEVTVDHERASLEYLLRFWDRNKGAYLYKLLGNQFIISKDFEYTKGFDLLCQEINDAKYSYDSPIHTFYENYRDALRRNFDAYSEDYAALVNLVADDVLAKNEYTCYNRKVELPNGKTIALQAGAKPMKLISKVIENLDGGVDGFEEFRLEHSRILNQKKLKGTMHLSIHPLDFMTMSDNDCGWRSCMNWMDDGEYRMGTVEMMNSRCVLVAYLSAEDDMNIGNGYEWNSKKWRNLVIVDRDLLSTVKGYPYQNASMEQFVIKWIAELAKENLGWEYADESIRIDDGNNYMSVMNSKDQEVSLNFETGAMYCDFGNYNSPTVLLSKEADEADHTCYLHIYYSGETECMYCGSEIDPDDLSDSDPSCLLCDDCYHVIHCDNCGDVISNDEVYELDGYCYCESCYSDYAETDAVTEEVHHRNNMHEVYLVSAEDIVEDDILRNDISYRVIYVYDNSELEDYFKEVHSGRIQSVWNGHYRPVDYVVEEENTDEAGLDIFSGDFSFQS